MMERDLSLDRCQGDCVIYARYSSHNQRDVSIEQQVADCEAYARSLGLRVVKVYADRALSGMTDKRPQFQTMLRDAAHRRWAYLIVWKIDRFARNRYDSATYKFRLKRCGVRVLYAKESIPDGPEGILLESVLEGSAEYYSANLSQNIRRGMRYNAMNCKVNSGSIPFGYRKGEDGRFAVDPGEAEVVREIFRKVADGIPFVEISNDLNGRGIRTKRGGLWGRNSFHRLLTNETYVGVYRFGDVRVEDGVPPVIDRALFLAVDERLKNKKNPQGRHRENGEYMLTGKLFCGLCGAPMVGVSGTARSGALHHYYVCQKRRTERSCSKANVGRDWLERVVVQATLDYVLKPEVIEWMADAVMAYQEREANSAVLLGLRDQLSENQRATANLMKAIEAGIITLTTKGRLVELEAEASRLRDAITLEEAAQTHIERDFMVYWFEKFRGGDLEDAAFRRRVIDSFVNAVYLWDDRLRVAFNYSGKGSAVDMELVMDAEALAGPEGLPRPPPTGSQANRGRRSTSSARCSSWHCRCPGGAKNKRHPASCRVPFSVAALRRSILRGAFFFRQLRLDQILDVALQHLGHLVELVDVRAGSDPGRPSLQRPNRDAAAPGKLRPGDPLFYAFFVDGGQILPHGYASHAAHLRLNCTAIILRLRGNVNSSTSPLIRVDICIV